MIIGVSGASGSIYGYRLLERLRRGRGVETHLILTRSAERTAFLESGRTADEFKALADFVHPLEDIGSRLASGSFLTHGMVIAPCSVHSMSAIATGLSSNLLVRAADVCLKERRKLILMVRETPLHLGHLRTMAALTEMGAIILPPVPGFYTNRKLSSISWTIAWIGYWICWASPPPMSAAGMAALALSKKVHAKPGNHEKRPNWISGCIGSIQPGGCGSTSGRPGGSCSLRAIRGRFSGSQLAAK